MSKKTYIMVNGKLVEKSTLPSRFREKDELVLDRFDLINPYKSPLGSGWISTYRERQNDLQRHGMREVDPSEYKPVYQNEIFMKKHGITNKERE